MFFDIDLLLMTFGPFPPHFIEILRAKLDSVGSVYQIHNYSEGVQILQEINRQRPLTNHPGFVGPADLLFIEIDPNHLSSVKPDLEKMGVTFEGEDFDPEFHREEYLCVRCDHVSEYAGLCPTHRTQLVDFSTYTAQKLDRSDRRARNWLLGFFIFVGLMIAYSFKVFK